MKQYGFGFDVQNVDGDDLTLPAAPQRPLRSARIAAPTRPEMEDLSP